MRHRAYQPNKIAEKAISFSIRSRQEKAFDEKQKRRKEKFEKDAAYYGGLLSDMVAVAMQQISPELTPTQIEEICAAGESGWKIICARIRATSSVIKPNNEAFRSALIDELMKKYPEAIGMKPADNE